ncbi:MAG: hypothetical protein H0V45_16295, partial [Actinobacteria bacterium]|nr:hypothetical protein [Actinomycetota bacterium]
MAYAFLNRSIGSLLPGPTFYPDQPAIKRRIPGIYFFQTMSRRTEADGSGQNGRMNGSPRTLVTGGTGKLGAGLVAALRGAGWQ